MSKQSSLDQRQLRAIGHRLNPIVTVGGNGLSDTVITELERALSQHELIKVKLAVGDRDKRKTVTEELLERTEATLVQSIGNIIVILRQADKPDPKLSNLIRPV